MYKNVIFDLDGTLLDTSEGVMKALEKTLQKLSLSPLSPKELKSFVGPVMQESLMKHFNMSAPLALENANLFREIYKEFLFEAKLYEGILELFLKLKAKGVKIAIATNKSHDNAMKILEKFELLNLCECAFGSDLEGKLDKASLINLCLETLKAKKQESVLIGDSSSDAKGALKVGIDFLAVLYGFGFKAENELKEYPYKACFKDVKELEKYLFERI